MNIIKLDAIDSTNTFLKDLIRQKRDLLNFTAVWAENQTKGRGQRESKWLSEPYKNLTFSILIRNENFEKEQVFFHNKYVAWSIVKLLSEEKIPDISIKWPNDIMSSNKKIGGILIENRFSSSSTIQSVVGIGLNVNQERFNNLPKASSIYKESGKKFDVEELLSKIIRELENNFTLIRNKSYKEIDTLYHSFLFKRRQPMAFELSDGYRFMGCIEKVDTLGKLCIRKEDNSIESYSIKEVKMLF